VASGLGRSALVAAIALTLADDLLRVLATVGGK